MFDALSDRLRTALGKLTGHGRITEADVDAAMREVRLALLEADVNFKVVKDFVGRVKARAIGHEVLESLNAGQQVIKIVNDELTAMLGAGDRTFRMIGAPAVVDARRPAGLRQDHTRRPSWRAGSSAQGRQPMLVAADPYRPAAVDQLVALGASLDMPVYRAPTGTPVDIVRGGHRRGASGRPRRRHPRHRRPSHDRRGPDGRDPRRGAGRPARRRPCSSSTPWSARRQ